jgi:hypothetical protein
MPERMRKVVKLNSQFRQGTKNSDQSDIDLLLAVEALNKGIKDCGVTLRIVANYLDNGSKLALGYQTRKIKETDRRRNG